MLSSGTDDSSQAGADHNVALEYIGRTDGS